MLDLQDITKVYRRSGRQTTALDKVSLHLERGRFATLTGPSGSGKTTLLMCVAGLLRPTAGRASVDGLDITAAGEGELEAIRRGKIGIVFQTFHLVNYLSAAENVMLPMGIAGASPADARKRAMELLEQLGLAGRARHFPRELSAGEQQRVALARAIANRPAMLLADEPTGNLDAASAQAVLAALRHVHQSGATVLVASHDAAVVSAADLSLALREGRLVG